MNTISIRRVEAHEIPELRQISIKTFTDKFASVNSQNDMDDYVSKNLSLEKLSQEFSYPHSTFYFAMSRETAIGYLKINVGDAQNECRNENALEIERIYVDQNFQGQKVGQKLFDKAVEIASEQQREFVWLGVWEHNPGAIRFYERNGFSVFGKHEFWLGKDLQFDLLMKKNLKI